MKVDSFLIVVFVVLGVFKLHDLFFHFNEKRTQKKLNEMLIQFYAEHTYRVMRNKKEYTDAPKYIYHWITVSFEEWQKENSKKIQ